MDFQGVRCYSTNIAKDLIIDNIQDTNNSINESTIITPTIITPAIIYENPYVGRLRI
jgi:hypothetical protein